MIAPSRPSNIREDYLSYLDNLRDSGATNMFHAGPYFMQEFPEINRTQAREIILYWMKTHSQWMETGER
jgi:hypothetical protein